MKVPLPHTCSSLQIVSWKQLLSPVGGLPIHFRTLHSPLIYDLFQGPEACPTVPSRKLARLCKNILEEPQGGRLLKLL